MPRLRKLLLNRHVVFITTGLEEGLLLPPNPLINSIIESSLARAQYQHPVRICHYLFESNHLHMVALIDNPDDIRGFMERFKTETAHAVNILLGRKRRTIWCKGYDSPSLLTVADCIDKIVYLYTNPAKDNLETSIDHFPGLSSWRAFVSEKKEKHCPWIRRNSLFALKKRNLTLRQYAGIAKSLKQKAMASHTFSLSPDAWMEAFDIDANEEKNDINDEIKLRIEERETELEISRQREARGVIGAECLVLQPMDTPYTPDRKGRKMWCICEDLDLRKRFISAAKELAREAREVFLLWRSGDFSRAFPPGLFAPCMPKLMEPLAIL